VTGTERASWGDRIGHFEAHYAGWRIDSDGLTYGAQRRTPRGPRGPKLRARTLDELGAAIEAAEDGRTP
jgi:hypothetical protein